MFERDISPTEWLYIAVHENIHSFANQIFIECVGNIDECKLKHAILKASDYCPGCRLVKKRKKWVDSGIPPSFNVINNIEFDGYNLDGLKFLNSRINHKEGTTCQVYLLRKGEINWLVFRSSHSVMDGIGTLIWVRTVFDILNGIEPKKIVSTITDYELLNNKGNSQYIKRIQKYYPSALGDKRCFKKEYTWKRFTICGQYNFITAKIANKLIEFSENNSLYIEIPVDLRRHILSELSTANLSLSIFKEIRKSDSWKKIQYEIINELKNNNELNLELNTKIINIPTSVLRFLIVLNDFYQFVKGGFSNSAIITNLMKVDLNNFSTSDFFARTIFCPPPHTGTPFVISVVECQQHFEVVFSYISNNNNYKKVCELINYISNDFKSTKEF